MKPYINPKALSNHFHFIQANFLILWPHPFFTFGQLFKLYSFSLKLPLTIYDHTLFPKLPVYYKATMHSLLNISFCLAALPEKFMLFENNYFTVRRDSARPYRFTLIKLKKSGWLFSSYLWWMSSSALNAAHSLMWKEKAWSVVV